MTNQVDPLERRLITELPRELDKAVGHFDAAAVARVATTRRRPSVLRVTAVTAGIAIAAITAVVAVEGLTGAFRQPGSPLGPSSTPQESEPPAASLDQVDATQRADAIISPTLTAAEWALIANARSSVIETCMQRLGWNFQYGTAAADTESEGPSALSRLEQWTFTDVASAQSSGFGLQSHLADLAATIERLDLNAGETRIPDPSTMNADEAARFEQDLRGREDFDVVIIGRDSSPLSMPGEGCIAEAERAVLEDIFVTMWLRDARSTAESDTWDATLSDRAVEDALGSWRGCIRQRGYAFDDPDGSFASAAEVARAGDFAEERAIATAHAECAAVSNLDLAVTAAFLAATSDVLPELGSDLRALQAYEEEALVRAKDILGFEE